MRSLVISLVVCCVASTVTGLYRECKNFPDKHVEDHVKVSNCKSNICSLKKGTKTIVEIKFTTANKTENLYNVVNAEVVGVKLPFIGTDGTNANKSIYEADGETPANFPLEPGKEYTFRHAINVLPIYPSINTVVHWQLNDDDGNPMACFEVPSKIVG